jgi:hypothetical protein
MPALRHAACKKHGPKQAIAPFIKNSQVETEANCPGSCQTNFSLKTVWSQNRYIF